MRFLNAQNSHKDDYQRYGCYQPFILWLWHAKNTEYEFLTPSEVVSTLLKTCVIELTTFPDGDVRWNYTKKGRKMDKKQVLTEIKKHHEIPFKKLTILERFFLKIFELLTSPKN